MIWKEQYHRRTLTCVVKISMVRCSRNKYKIYLCDSTWIIIVGTDIATAAGGVVGVVFVVDQSSLTVIWSMDRYNEH